MYLSLDCEFTEQGLVREFAMVLFKNNEILKVLEVYITKSGGDAVPYNPLQNNYHINDATHLNIYINGFLDTCAELTPLSQIKIVGMSLDHDLKSIFKTTNKQSKLNKLTKKTQLEMCGRGTLETKATNYNISKSQMRRLMENLTTPKHRYKYHTALYDAVVTGYVYLKVTNDDDSLTVHPDLKNNTHTYFTAYHNELHEAYLAKRNRAKVPVQKEAGVQKVPKNFPEIRYRVQKNISNVFDIVARQMFYHQLCRLRYEPSIRKVNAIKENIMREVYLAKVSVMPYDTMPLITDPYNPSIVNAGVQLVLKKISTDDFIDFAIYMQQYNLPRDKGTYYRVWNNKKEIYVRCLQTSTAKKLLTKLPYATIDHFLRKEIPECYIETIN